MAGQNINSHYLGEAGMPDGCGVLMAAGPPGGRSCRFNGHQRGVGHMGAQPVAALGQRLRMGVDRAYRRQSWRIAQETVCDTGK